MTGTATPTPAVTPATAAAIPTATTTAAARTGLRLEAVVAVDGTVTAGLERHACFLATGTARGAEHFAGTAAHAAGAPAFAAATCGSAVRATAWLIAEALGLMEFLLAGCEGECCPTVATGKNFVGETHSTTSN